MTKDIEKSITDYFVSERWISQTTDSHTWSRVTDVYRYFTASLFKCGGNLFWQKDMVDKRLRKAVEMYVYAKYTVMYIRNEAIRGQMFCVESSSVSYTMLQNTTKIFYKSLLYLTFPLLTFWRRIFFKF